MKVRGQDQADSVPPNLTNSMKVRGQDQLDPLPPNLTIAGKAWQLQVNDFIKPVYGWLEIKQIRGNYYLYHRYRDNDIKRSIEVCKVYLVS
jgi:hypothetical protein